MANSSYYASGKGKATEPQREFEPAIDKNPVYQTNDTFKRAYKKNIVVKEGDVNKTDCVSTIWLKFSDPIDRKVVKKLGVEKGRTKYLLECGHEWEGRLAGDKDELPCDGCGQEQGYLSFEHEWQHILFKTDPKMAKLFITPWAMELRKRAPHVDQEQLEKFLFFVLNAFDDIRCNSLWELLYAGSADRIWQRWTRISNGRGAEANSENFIAFLFAIALGTPTLPDGPFEDLRPVIEWGMHHVRYKGYQRGLLVAKMALDGCLDKLISQLHPPPPSQQDAGEGNGQGQAHQGQAPGDGDGASVGVTFGHSGDAHGSHSANDGGSVPGGATSAAQPAQSPEPGLRIDPVQASNALSSLLRNSDSFDEKEDHYLPESLDPSTVSDIVRAQVVRMLQTDPNDPQLWQQLGSGGVDGDMQTTIDQFRDSVAQITPDSQLMANAKAKILFLDVRPEDIDPASAVTLSTKEKEGVDRMRGVFFRTQGRQRVQRSASGTNLDLDAAIQYDIDPSDPEIFENEQNNQGFAYLTLCDMSGSMSGIRFQQVSHATEMLKKSLHFPFVDGTLWGFRGGEARGEAPRDAWIYRYDKACTGYLGQARVHGKPQFYPVECGGLTPMHSAIRVAVRHLLTQVSTGMAKRLFLLTDGSPCSVKTDGNGLPYHVLQQYVAKEIQWARQRGVHVYTLVIDGGLEDRECRLMFGPPKFWRSASSKHEEDSIDRVLQKLVIQNFERYLKSRG
jgi:hypothetical protein